TILHRGHCEALMVSIICSGCRLHGYSRGWAAPGAAWLPSNSGLIRLRVAGRSTSGLQEGHPVVGGEAADGVGEGPSGVRYLAAVRATGELPDALHDLRDAGAGRRVAAGLEAARGIDGQAPVDRRVAVERRPPR